VAEGGTDSRATNSPFN